MSDSDMARAGGLAGPYLRDRLSDELLGICRGILMDGAVVDREIQSLAMWCHRNHAASRDWPGNVIVARLRRMLRDGLIDEDERRDLHLLLEDLTNFRNGAQEPAADIYTEPAPELVIIEQHFTLTGEFLYGPRKKVVEIIQLIGGSASSTLTSKTDFLLVGGRATAAWIAADHGTKILEVLERNARAAKSRRVRNPTRPIPIVSEAHWSKFILKPEP